MNYICCQLLSLIEEDFDKQDILWELRPDRDEIRGYIYDADYKPDDLFDKEDLEEWLDDNGWVKKE
jgi:hypothetical protein